MSDELVRRIADEIRNAETAYSVPAPRWREVAAERIAKVLAERIEALEAERDGWKAAAKRAARSHISAEVAIDAEREKVARLVEAVTEIRRLGRLVAHDLNGRVEAGKTAAVWRLADMADAALASVQDGAQEGEG